MSATPLHRMAFRLLLGLGILAAGLALTSPTSAETDEEPTTIAADPFVWHLDKDYPGAHEVDADLPISRVLIKTHDETDWMSEYDEHPLAVSGPEALELLIDIYAAQEIEVAAWFVPKGTDVETQLEMANQVIDTGVTALYADVEGFAGFCTPDCEFLADNFWSELRAQRPDVTLGVIYDPREPWVDYAFAAKWLANADVAVPMCYWESYADQGAWGDPAGCVYQSYYRLLEMMDGQPIAYEPALQGNSTPARFSEALDAAMDLGSERVTVWRRGVVSLGTWDAIASFSGTVDRPCWLELSDGCLLTEVDDADVYIVEGGARFLIPDTETLEEMGYAVDDVDLAPDGFIAALPTVPQDGTLIAELGGTDIFVVYGGARFEVFESPLAETSLVFDLELTRTLPPGALEQVPTVPDDYNRFREETGEEEYLVVAGGKLVLDEGELTALTAAGYGEQLYIVPDGALADLPLNEIVRGDVSCSGSLNAVDALMLLQTVAGLPNPGVCSTGDVDCSGSISAVDALPVLRHIAGLSVVLPPGCPPVDS